MFQEFKEVIANGDVAGIVSSTLGQIIIWIVSIVILLLMVIIKGKKKSKNLKIKELTYSSIAIALATVFSMLKIIPLPQGGSVTLFSMLFIVVIGYWFGASQGILCGLVYGLIQLVLNGYVVHPVQLLLDYPLAFAALGFSGFFRNQKMGLLKGYLVGTFGRFIFHVISGVVFFAEYAGDLNPVLYSVIYNGSFIGLEALITGVIIVIPSVTNAMQIVKKRIVTE